MASIKNIEEGVCGQCGLSADFDAWRVIDAADADLKRALLDGSLFLWTCPHCGYRCQAYYELVYDDEAKDFRLLLTGEEGREALLALAASMPPRALGRSVADGHALREKIRILEDGVDDRAMETYKLFLRQYIGQQSPAPQGNSHDEKDQEAPFVYQGKEGGGFLLSRRSADGDDAPRDAAVDEDDWTGYDEGKLPKLIMASAAIYEDMLADIQKSDGTTAPYPYIDEAWAGDYLSREGGETGS